MSHTLTDEQIAAIRNAALEEAEKVCDGLSTLYERTDVGFDVGYTVSAKRAANEIRNLASTPAKQTEAPQDYETRRAIMEGERNAAADEYFKARPQLDGLGNRRIFEAGFQRGFDRTQQTEASTVPSAEPVLYQYRTRPMWLPDGQGWSNWMTCSKECANDYKRLPIYNDWQSEVRELFAAAPAPTAAPEAQSNKDEDPLVKELVAIFGWTDTSYLHALLHVKNAVQNLRADLAVAKQFTAPEAQQSIEKDAAHLAEIAGCFSAAYAEGLQKVLAETTDERLKDLVERRLLPAYDIAALAQEQSI